TSRQPWANTQKRTSPPSFPSRQKMARFATRGNCLHYPLLGEELFDILLNQLFFVRSHAEVLFVDFPVLGYDVCGGEAALPAEAFNYFIVSYKDWVLHFKLRDFGFDLVEASGFDGDRKHLHALALVFSVQVIKVGNLQDTGSAPRGPEVDDGHHAFNIGGF